MDNEVLVNVEKISKKFCRKLKRSLWYGMKDIAGELFLQDRSAPDLRKDEFWAVRDVSFSLKRGEVLGLIGKNGAGKTTILRLINGLIKPDQGRITVKGRVGALIQLGAGFHSLLTGRENIYINGSILGMSKREIDQKLQDIIDFSGVGDFIDAPVQNYSSGMYVRLGFSIAVHLSPDILLIDEVLAVGDAGFRSRAMDRMWELVSSRKAAIIFISHNMPAIEGICDRVILMDKGNAYTGSKAELIARYLGDDVSMRWQKIDPETREKMLNRFPVNPERQTGEIEISSVTITDKTGQPRNAYHSSESIRIKVAYRSKRRLERVIFSISLRDPSGLILFVERSHFHGVPHFTVDRHGTLEIEFCPIRLKTGRYILGLAFQDPSLEGVYCMRIEDTFRVIEEMPNPGGKEGFFSPSLVWYVDGKTYRRA